jgi:hypothetical protein
LAYVDLDGVDMDLLEEKLTHALTFREFAESVKPSVALNRVVPIGHGPELKSYSVYMNGPLAQGLSDDTREYAFNDVTLHALTQKLGLDPKVSRDNLLVAGMVALRDAWLGASIQAWGDRTISLGENVLADLELLSEGLEHPWIDEQIERQREMSKRLQPLLLRANGVIVGQAELPPNELVIGEVVAQDNDFTVQATADGVVTHENKRLDALPAMGEVITVAYYQGHGQVISGVDKWHASEPYIDAASGDLAIKLIEPGKLDHIVLFNSVASFDNFVTAHTLDHELVGKALDARSANPKERPPAPSRTAVSEVYVDRVSGCLAVDYVEKGSTFTALFRNAQEMMGLAAKFGLNKDQIRTGQVVGARESGTLGGDKAKTDNQASISVLQAALDVLGKGVAQVPKQGPLYAGTILAESKYHVAQNMGRAGVVMHDKRNLDKNLTVGESASIKYAEGRGSVQDVKQINKSQAR